MTDGNRMILLQENRWKDDERESHSHNYVRLWVSSVLVDLDDGKQTAAAFKVEYGCLAGKEAFTHSDLASAVKHMYMIMHHSTQGGPSSSGGTDDSPG